MNETCQKKISDGTGFHFWACGKPAKYIVKLTANNRVFTACGIHANQAKRRLDATVTPLSDEASP